MYKISVLILTLTFFLYPAIDSFAQDTASFIHFNTDNGLPSNNVYCGVEDGIGNIWLGTDDGVVKYNGYSFRTFTTDDGLPTNDVWKLWKDSVGRIWLYSLAAKFGYIKDDKYYPIDIGINENIFRVVAEGVKGDKTIFVASGTYDISFVVDNDGNVVGKYGDKNNKLSHVGMTADVKIYKRDSKRQHTLSEFQFVNNEIRLTRVYKDTITNNPRYTVSTDVFGKYVFSFTHIDKSIQFDFVDIITGKAHTVPIQAYGGNADEKIYVRLKEPINATIITNKAVYVFLDEDFSKVKRIDYKKIIPTNSQLSYFMNDRNGNTWYMTNSDGVWMHCKAGNFFRKNNAIKAIENAVYKGHSNKGSSYWFDKEKEKLVLLSSNGKVLRIIHTSKSIVKVKPYQHNKVLISSLSTIDIYDEDEDELKQLVNKYKYRYDARMKTYYKVGDSLYRYALSGMNDWVYLNDSVLFMMSSAMMSKIVISNDTLKSLEGIIGKYYGIFSDTFNNKVWLYNQSTIYSYDIVTDAIQSYSKNLLDFLGIKNIVKIVLDRYANFYILSDKNLITYNSQSGIFKSHNLNVDLNHAVLESYNNMLFIGGNFGLAYCKINGPSSLSEFRIAPNIKGANYSRVNSFFWGVDSIGIIGTDKGAYKINMAELLSANNLISSNDMSYIKVVAKLPKEVVLSNNDTFTLDQTIPSISIDMNNMYGKGKSVIRYRVEGYSDWQEVKSGDIILAGLKVGQHYNIYCNVKDDLWNSKTFKFTVYRTPKWWQTKSWRRIFWVGGILSFALLIFIAVIVTRYIVAKKNAKRQQLTDLELRAIYSQINPHFIFNTLSAALFFIDKKDFDQAYTHISKFSRLLRSYIKSSQERYVSIAEEIRMLENYIELQQTRFENKFNYDIEVENKIAIDSILIPSLLLQPLVENAINHGLFHKQTNGELVIRFKQGESSDELICEIEDNGVGRVKSGEIQKEDSSKKESYGTKLTQSLIEIFKEYEKMNIYMEYIDKSLPESGTIVKLTIKKFKYVA